MHTRKLIIYSVHLKNGSCKIAFAHCAKRSVLNSFVYKCQTVDFLQEFLANYDQTTSVTQHLTNVIYARFIRLHPTVWEGTAGMRTEFLGCYVGKFKEHGYWRLFIFK